MLAISWLTVGVVGTVLFAPKLGLRGLFWLGVHDLLCLVGCSHELWRAWRRARQSQTTATPAASSGSPPKPQGA